MTTAQTADICLPRSIVAVHGLNGHSIKSWTHTSGTGESTLWLEELLHTKIPGARVMTFGYDATVLGNTSAHGVRANATNLLQDLRNSREGDVRTGAEGLKVVTGLT